MNYTLATSERTGDFKVFHDIDSMYTLTVKKLNESALNIEEKTAILNLHNKLLADGFSKHRVYKYLQVLRLIPERTGLSYHRMDENDVYSTVASIKHNWNLKHDAQRDYLLSLRKMLEWLDRHDLAGLITNNKKKVTRHLPLS